MTCSLDFVDSIGAAPTVRLNLSDGVTWILNANETDFSPPPMREAIAQTLLADGGVVPSSAYDFRRITLGLFLSDDTPDDTAAALQSLYRELDRPGGNILRWHDHTTHPVFFRTFRASAHSVRQLGRDGRRKKIEVELRAEPFAYGLREDPVSAVTVSADPAAGSNGCFVDVTGVKGDVESPAIIEWPSTSAISDRQTLWAVRRRGTPSSAPFLIQAESMTQGTDTSVQANDPLFSGSGSNYSQCTFGTDATMQTRLSVTTVGTSGVDLRGRYRVFMRAEKTFSDNDVRAQLRWGGSTASLITNDAHVFPPSDVLHAVDLGEINIPSGVDPGSDPAGAEVDVSNSVVLQVQAERTSGSGSINMDFLLLVPADDRFAIVEWREFSGSLDHYNLDASDNSVHARNASDHVASILAPKLVGGLPMLSPGQSNRVYMLRDLISWPLATASPVSVSYFPRYLTVRPAST